MTVPATIGVDLAAEPAGTAVVRIAWEADRPRATLLPAKDDNGVLDAIEAHDVVKAGIDCPFGWPDGFLDAIGRHRSDQQWEAGSGMAARRPLRFRLTDEDVAQRFREPLPVSSSYIGVTAMRWAAMLSAWRFDRGHDDDRVGTGRLVEVYPALAMHHWCLDVDGYKNGDGWRSAREAILELLERHITLDPWFGDHVLGSKTYGDDPIDALVAALVAGAAATVTGGTAGPPEVGTPKRRIAEDEGWIAVPTIELRDLAAAVRAAHG